MWLSYKQNISNGGYSKMYGNQKRNILICNWNADYFFNCISLFSFFAHLSFCATHLASTQILMNSPICLPSDSTCIAKYYLTRKKYDYELFNQGPGNLLQFSTELTFFLCKVGLFLESISSGLNGRPPRRYTLTIHCRTY